MAVYDKCPIYNLNPSYAYRKFKCRCDVCRKHKSVTRVLTDEQRVIAKEKSRLWRLENIERSRNNSKEYQRKNPNMVLKWSLKKYGMCMDDYNELLASQCGKCAICGGDPRGMSNSIKRLSVDHDHITGKNRGLLCGACNIGLGHFNDDIALLSKAIKYLLNGEVE